MLLLTSKGNADAWGIGLLVVVWKVLEAVIDTRIKTEVQYHKVLCRFCAGKGTGTATMELKLTQELASMEQDPYYRCYLI